MYTFSTSFSVWDRRGLQGMMPALLNSRVTWELEGESKVEEKVEEDKEESEGR